MWTGLSGSADYLFIMSSYTKYKYNRMQNTGKMKNNLKKNSKKEEEKRKRKKNEASECKLKTQPSNCYKLNNIAQFIPSK